MGENNDENIFGINMSGMTKEQRRLLEMHERAHAQRNALDMLSKNADEIIADREAIEKYSKANKGIAKKAFAAIFKKKSGLIC